VSVYQLNPELSVSREEVLDDYRLACESRQASTLARKEVYSGKAKFGVFGTGKEVAQIAMAKFFQPGDSRSGYYRDQTFMMAIGELSLQQYFAQLYAHTDIDSDPHSGGRMMIGHYGTRNLDRDGNWKDLTKIKMSTPDISPTGAQMPRLVGMAFASKLYRANPDLHHMTQFSNNGNEVAYGTIGNGACAEGIFFEAINAAGVLQIPMIISIWDDAYAISVTQELQTTKLDISAMFEGFRRNEQERGIEIVKVKGWSYKDLCVEYFNATNLARYQHVPVLFHVEELTQPFGHSTSGSHERYKPKDRLIWEEEYDCNKQFKKWILEWNIASEEELNKIEHEALDRARKARQEAWDAYMNSLMPDHEEALKAIEAVANESKYSEEIIKIKTGLAKTVNPIRSDAVKAVKKVLRIIRDENLYTATQLKDWVNKAAVENKARFNSHVWSQSPDSALKVAEVKPEYNADSQIVDGREILVYNFDALLAKDGSLRWEKMLARLEM
jgi:2-oxoisovalerate dehydrogenase E1 component